MLGGKYPRVSTIYLRPDVDAGEAGELQVEALARYPMIVLSMECLGYAPDLPSRIRAYNPDITIFGFLPLTNTWSWDPYKVNGVLDPTTGCGQLAPSDKLRDTITYQLSKAINDNNFWLRAAPTGTQEWGDPINYGGYDNLFIPNFTDDCPVGTVGNAAGLKFKEWLPYFWESVPTLFPTWNDDFDGIYFDNVWEGLYNINLTLVDSNQDGITNYVEEGGGATVSAAWALGVQEAVAGIRSLLPSMVIWGNQIHLGTTDYLNGAWLESIGTGLTHGSPDDENNVFHYKWTDAITAGYGANAGKAYLQMDYKVQPLVSGINYQWWLPADRSIPWNGYGNWPAGPLGYTPALHGQTQFLRDMRLWVGSCALGDGYFFFDDAADHSDHLWIEPYYSMDWGAAIGPYTTYVRGGNTIYRRDFTNGVVIVNPHNTAVAAEGEIPSIPAWDAFLGTTHYDGFAATIRPAKIKVKRGTIRPH